MSELELEAKMQKILEDYGSLLNVTPKSEKIESNTKQSKDYSSESESSVSSSESESSS